MMKTRMLLILFVLCFLPAVALSEFPAQLSEDFTQVSGYVVMPIGSEYLIDLDTSNGISEGDIVTVVQPGEKIIHPVTLEVIGTLDDIKGFLKVTRVKSGYSYAASVGPVTGEIIKGDKISRFYMVPSRLEDDTADRNVMLADIKKSLPQLDWLSATSSQQALLVFQRQGSGLLVLSDSGETLFAYPLASKVATPVQVKPAPVVAIPSPVPAVPAVSVPTTVSVQPQGAPGQETWNSPAFDDAAVAMTVGDFDGDGQQEIALVLGKTLKIVRNLQGQLTELSSIKISTGVVPLSLDTFDLDGNGESDILLTAIKDGKTAVSQVVEFQQGSYQTTITGIPWFLRVVNFPGEGPVLLGQGFEGENGFSKGIFRILRNGNQLSRSQPLPLPERVNIYGFAPFTDDNGQSLYVYYSATDYLNVITPAGEVLWESDVNYGGSEVSFNLHTQESDGLPVAFYIKPRILVSPENLLILSQNDGVRLLQGFRRFQPSRAIAMKWNGLALSQVWKTVDQGGYLNDLELADMDNDGQVELLTFVKFKHKGLFKKARSALVAYELN